MDVPSSVTGTVAEVRVKVGDKIGQGDLILVMEAAAETGAPKPGVTDKASKSPGHRRGEQRRAQARRGPADTAPPRARPWTASACGADAARPGHRQSSRVEVLVLGAGPGGYTAAFRAADLGLKVVLVERWARLGGVCLNVGCIPSKALLHAAKVIDEARAMAAHGIAFTAPEIDIDKLRGWKDGVVGRLTGGLGGLAKQRKVTVVPARHDSSRPHQLEVEHEGGKKTIGFDQAIIAAGSRADPAAVHPA